MNNRAVRAEAVDQRRWTIHVCNKGHVGASSLNGVCWACFPGGRRTWEPGRPKQTEPNQQPVEVMPVPDKERLEAAREVAVQVHSQADPQGLSPAMWDALMAYEAQLGMIESQEEEDG